eukprot:scaffold1243_cov403-Prasinococcus_capsulatus_cf.AAC.23
MSVSLVNEPARAVLKSSAHTTPPYPPPTAGRSAGARHAYHRPKKLPNASRTRARTCTGARAGITTSWTVRARHLPPSTTRGAHEIRWIGPATICASDRDISLTRFRPRRGGRGRSSRVRASRTRSGWPVRKESSRKHRQR